MTTQQYAAPRRHFAVSARVPPAIGGPDQGEGSEADPLGAGQTVARPAAVNAARTRAIWLASGGVTSAQG
jgi:hypothetical protein